MSRDDQWESGRDQYSVHYTKDSSAEDCCIYALSHQWMLPFLSKAA